MLTWALPRREKVGPPQVNDILHHTIYYVAPLAAPRPLHKELRGVLRLVLPHKARMTKWPDTT